MLSRLTITTKTCPSYKPAVAIATLVTIIETNKKERKKNNNNIIVAGAVLSAIYVSHLRPLLIICLLLKVVPPTFENGLKAYISPW